MKVEKNKVVKIHYTLKGDDGTVIDDSVPTGRPLEYIHGNNYLLTKLEEAIEGHEEGDKIHADLTAAEGYGEYNEKLVLEVPKTQFDPTYPPQVGMKFQAQTSDGVGIVTVIAVSDETVTVDANHELAGQALHFDVEVVEIRDATEDELANGLGGGCCCGGGCGGDCGGDCSCDGGCGEGGCGCGN